MTIRPQLAEDAILDQVKFPCIVQPKIDGVRALNLNGTLTGRSLKKFEGFGITERFSGNQYLGLDGEMILGSKPNCTDRLCSLTTGAMGRFNGVDKMADLQWNVFDLVLSVTEKLPYIERYRHLTRRVAMLQDERITLVPMFVVDNAKHLEHNISEFFAAGYEGTIIRNPDVSSVRSIVQALMTGFEGSPATRQALLDAMFLRGGDSVLMHHHQAFLAASAGRARLQVDLTPESAFVLTHAAISLLRAAAAEQELGLDPARLEDELVRLMEAYVGALVAAKRA